MTRYATTPLPTADEAEYTLPGATNRQLDYIASLLQQREVKPETAAALGPKIAVQFVANEERGDSAPAVDGISKKRASESISKLLALPKRRNELPARPAKTRDIVAETRSQTVADRITPEKVPAGHCRAPLRPRDQVLLLVREAPHEPNQPTPRHRPGLRRPLLLRGRLEGSQGDGARRAPRCRARPEG
jgi:hypothetical protein